MDSSGRSGRISGVLASPEVAAQTARLFRDCLKRAYRLDRVRFTTEVWDFVDGLDIEARRYRSLQGNCVAGVVENVASTTPDPGSYARVKGMLTTAEVAKVRGCSPQAVTAQIRRGRLPAVRDDHGRWRVDPQNLG